MRAMMVSAFVRCTSSLASECAMTAMSAAMPHSSALSARGAATDPAAAAMPAASARVRVNAKMELLGAATARTVGAAAAQGLRRGVLRADAFAGRRCRAAHRAGAARGRAGGAARAAHAAIDRAVFLGRELAVVVAVELAEARVELVRVARLIARDEAVAVA